MDRQPAYPRRAEHRSATSLRRILIDVKDRRDDPWTELRIRLLADVLRRALKDLSGQRAVVLTNGSSRGRGAAYASHLQIREPDGRSPPAGDSDGSSDPRNDIGLAAPEGSSLLSPGQLITVAGGSGSAILDAPFGDDVDAVAVRLALLRFAPATPADLTRARLHRAEQTLRRWRFKLAGWAEMPPASSGEFDAIGRSLLGVLDTPAVLTVLHRLEIDHAVPSGTKYVTFARADHILGLDLLRIVHGKYCHGKTSDARIGPGQQTSSGVGVGSPGSAAGRWKGER